MNQEKNYSSINLIYRSFNIYFFHLREVFLFSKHRQPTNTKISFPWDLFPLLLSLFPSDL